MTTEAFIASVIAGVIACITYELVSYIYLTIRSNKYVKKLTAKCKIFLNELNIFLDYNEKDKKYPKCTIKDFKEKVIYYNTDNIAGYNYLKILSDLNSLNNTLLKSMNYPYLTKRKFIYFQKLHEKFYNIEYSLMLFAGNYNYGKLSDGTIIPVTIDNDAINITDIIECNLNKLNHSLKIKGKNKNA